MNATDFLCGLMAGWTQIIVGQPLDFIKVRIQTAQKPSPSIPSILRDIYSQYGLKGFYRGASSMFFGFAFTIGTEFLIYEWAKRFFYSLWGGRGDSYNPDKLKIWEIGLSGAVVGAAVSFIYCPVEYTKIQKQMSGKITESALSLLFREFGTSGIRNIFKGFWATAFREVFGTIFYYGSYESIVRAYTANNREIASNLVFMNAGAVAGLSYHFFTYPIDTVKTNMQAGLNLK